MQYLLIASDQGGTFNVAKFEALGDAYECFTHLQSRRSRWKTMTILKKTGRSEKELYHWTNPNPIVLSHLGASSNA